MSLFSRCRRLFTRPHLQLILLIGILVPRRLRADWQQEWEAELRYREALLAGWDRLDSRHKFDLLWRSTSAFWDALRLQPKRLEDEMFQDLRYGARMLAQNPGFTLAAVLCLALGIGANTTIFSLMSALLFRPAQGTEPEQLVALSRGRGLAPPLSYPDFVTFRDNNDVLTGLAASDVLTLSFNNGDRSELLVGEMVSGNYFEVLGIQPVLGRMFLPEEDRTPGTHTVAVISYNLWQNRLGSNPNIIGETITLNSHRFTVIGIAPPGFGRTIIPGAIDLWVPAMMVGQLEQAQPGRPTGLDNRLFERWGAIGRLKPGVPIEKAQAALEAINRQIEQANPPAAGQPPVRIEERSLKLIRPYGIYLPHLRRWARMVATLLAAVVGIVLLIACANVANLLLARASVRRKEIAIRLAVGASRRRLIRQLLTESFLLALLGAGAGLILAFWLNRSLMAFKPPAPPPWTFAIDLRLDAQVLGFTLLLTFVTSLIFGLVPALQASKPDLIPALKNETGSEMRRGRRFNLRGGLVVTQIAISLVLLISAGLFIRSLQHLQAADPGFQVENGLTLSFQLQLHGYDKTRGSAFIPQLIERVAALPGMQSVSAVSYVPLGSSNRHTEVMRPGREDQAETVGLQIVGTNFFQTMGMSLLRGRDFAAQDNAAAPKVTIINETLARRFFPGEDALGKQLRDSFREGVIYEVVGIAKDTAFRNLGEAPRPIVYRPFEQEYSPTMSLVARTTGDPNALFSQVRREVNALDSNLPTQDLRTMSEHVSFSLWPARMGAAVIGVFGLLGLLLASVGIYGVMAYSVTQRTREIGIRMALGAQGRGVMKLIVKQGMILTLIGVLIGLSLSFAVTRLLTRMLYDVSATDRQTFAGVSLVVLIVALLACYLPARRATKVDPLVALRNE